MCYLPEETFRDPDAMNMIFWTVLALQSLVFLQLFNFVATSEVVVKIYFLPIYTLCLVLISGHS